VKGGRARSRWISRAGERKGDLRKEGGKGGRRSRIWEAGAEEVGDGGIWSGWAGGSCRLGRMATWTIKLLLWGTFYRSFCLARVL
jgi:hypothetical protein